MMKMLMESMQQPKRLAVQDGTNEQLRAMKIARRGYEEAGKMKEIAAKQLAHKPNEAVVKMAAEQIVANFMAKLDAGQLSEDDVAVIAAKIPLDVQSAVLHAHWADKQSFPKKVLKMSASQFAKGMFELNLQVFRDPMFKMYREHVLSIARKIARKQVMDDELYWLRQAMEEKMVDRLMKQGLSKEDASSCLTSCLESESEQDDQEESEEEEANDDDEETDLSDGNWWEHEQ